MNRDEKEYLRERIQDASPEIPIMVPVHLSTCQDIADCFMVNRGTVRKWKEFGSPIALIGGRLACEYNQLMAWLVRQS
jgi:hypothetical protein